MYSAMKSNSTNKRTLANDKSRTVHLNLFHIQKRQFQN